MNNIYDKMFRYLLSDENALTLKNCHNEWDYDFKYFACHKSHEKTVLAMLNGAKGQCRPIDSDQTWSDCNLGVKGEWSARFWYVSDKFESRIVEEK